MTAPRAWGYAPARIGGLTGLYCVTPDCGARILEDGTRLYDHAQGCETAKVEKRHQLALDLLQAATGELAELAAATEARS